MLLIQKYLNSCGVESKSPVSDKWGLLCYYVEDKHKGTSYNFTYYSWEHGKNHPGYYVFKFFTAGEAYPSSTSFMVKDTLYTTWSDYFLQIEKIKKEMQSAKEYRVASSSLEASNMLWRAFLRSQDITLASIYSTLPSTFFASVDDALSQEDQKKARDKFLQFIRDRYFIIYNNWVYFFEIDLEMKFCNWFYEYVTE